MLANLETMMEGAHGTHTRIRCICHVFNLAVKVTSYCNFLISDDANANFHILGYAFAI